MAFSWTDGAGGGGGGGVSAHGALTGLGNDDHTQYLLANGNRNTQGFTVMSQYGGAATLLPTFLGSSTGIVWVGEKGAFRAGMNTLGGWAQDKIGSLSTAFGDQSEASGYASFAVGTSAKASKDYAVSMGLETVASGQNSTAIGRSAVASGNGSMALHSGTATAYESFALRGLATGASATSLTGEASGNNAISLGGTASGENSFSLRGVASGESSVAIGQWARTNGFAGAVVIDARPELNSTVNARQTGHFVVRASGFYLGNVQPIGANPTGQFLSTSTNAYLSTGGNWTNSSDSTKKSNFRAVDGEQVLSKLASLPVYTWQYKAEDSTVRHMGPTAQAFRKAFGLGDSETAIGTVDIDGVAMAGVKALETRTKQLKAETQALRAENAQMAERLAQLESLVARLTPTNKER
ncbi:MAG: tail fiber domain-containing protein [Gemmatimonadaceae bacterium]|nr:tail fiber domain-containing protein [Gemmatimonadaceae bacterium]